ncbi:MAG: hypothetical protein PVI03_02725 [Candidatus Thorarchaeota archaeon]|jgi:hypothetical protein
MQTVALKRVRIRKILDFLSRNYSRVVKKEWREGDKIFAVFVHEEYVFRTSSNQTITTLVEYDKLIEKGLCTIVASGSGEGIFQWDFGSGSAGEKTVRSKIENIIRTDEMRDRLYCFNCDKWDDYDVESGQTEVTCRICGQRIKIQ